MDVFSRLPVATVASLEAAGWHAGRRVDVSDATRTLESYGYVTSPVVLGFLESLWALKVQPANEDGPNFINGEAFIVDPLGVGKRHRDEAVAISAALGGSWCPIGWWLSYSHVFMEESGAMVACANGLIWGLGDAPESGLDFMVRAHRPLACLHVPEGMKAWPVDV
ncbi:SUKH-3 domain-containing protein [Streptomyces sp. ADI97-07]|uniref:SUKH-3 domain-containing protein n=1 Tax=Streptomyces sp. ADI97-07 TaxID=1522762 RepID=UPI0019CFA836|nr:SUKH-3 domain-containing protein [Streptomyces sp. ADI97-07]